MFCPRCKVRVANGKKFCGDCGAPLPWFCHACGSENAPGNRICKRCGTASIGAAGDAPPSATPTLPAAPPAERRQLTVMFADLIGSTSLGVRLDAEDLRDVIDAWRGCVTAIVGRYGGLVTRIMGDGILAVFGFPHAHETDTEQAVCAGLAIIEAVSQLHTVAGPPGTLSMRVGLATGLVIIGDLIGTGPALEWSVVGETPNLAARLQGLAERDMLVIDEVTHELIGRMFECARLGVQQLKGIPSPVRPWAVLRESGIESRFKALRSDDLPLVGRVEESALLDDCWASARAGQGQAVLLVGEPGLGKSRLIAGFEARIGSGPRAVVRLTCSPQFKETPLFPVIRYLERAAGFERSDEPVRKRSKLQDLLRSTGDLASDEIDLMADLLALPTSAGVADRLSAKRNKELTFQAFMRHLAGLARRAPLLIVVEDLHWVDSTTRDLLGELIDRLEHMAVLLLISTRPERQMPWSSRPRLSTRLLTGLNEEQAAVLVRHVAGESGIADEVVARIVERAGGVPLFLEELTRNVLVARPPSPGDDRHAPPLLPAGNAVPLSLNALLSARLDQAGLGKEVAQASSVIGRECTLAMLKTVSALPTQRLRRAVEELRQTGLIVTDSDAPADVISFKHTLIQDVAYSSMLRERRRIIHRRYAEALEMDGAGPASTAPELLAAHFAKAGLAEKSVDYYLKAAARATGRFALAEIIGYLERGMQQLPALPPSTATQKRELALLVALGRALMEHRGAGDEQVRVAMERAHELCLSLGETDKLVQVHDGLANYHFAHAALDKLVECAEQALDLGHRIGNPHAVVLARRSSGYAKLLLGRFGDAREDLEEALAGYAGELAITRDPKVSSCAALGICLTAQGLPESGLAVSLGGLRHAETLSSPISLNLGLRRACVQAVMRRDLEQVRLMAQRLLQRQTDYETFRGVREGTFFATWAEWQTTHDPALKGRLRSLVDQFDSARYFDLLTFFMIATAEVMLADGDHPGADRLLRRAAELAESTNERWCEAEILRLRASLTQDQREAARLLEASVTVARQQGARLWELRAATALAEMHAVEAREEMAYQVLAPVVAQATEGLDMADFCAARELLGELRIPNP